MEKAEKLVELGLVEKIEKDASFGTRILTLNSHFEIRRAIRQYDYGRIPLRNLKKEN